MLLSILLSACSGGQNFSQFPGFSEFYNNHPPSDELPNAAETALLDLYKPSIYLANNQPGPVDFYADYIAHGSLTVAGNKLDQTPTRDLLNQYRDEPDAIFEYEGDFKNTGTAVVYARLDTEKTIHKGRSYDFTFLTYNLVFPVSGILQGIGKLQSFGLTFAASLDDWHQLDHYVSASIALLDSKPVAMTLQQHNYQTTYLLNPESPDLAVDIAMRSNELYPHNSSLHKHPAVSFLAPDNIEFLLTDKNKPTMAGYDITSGEKELNYKLVYLPHTDAFYRFQGLLGKRRLLPGRSGPPGADYATLPGLLPRHVRMVTSYRTNNVKKEIELFDALFDRENFAIKPDAISAYKDRFFELLPE